MSPIHILAYSSLCAIAAGAGLVDDPIAGDSLLYLDGASWTVSNGSTTWPASVPGDLLTDLQLAGVIGDPLYETTFRGNVWDATNYTYQVTFNASAAASAAAAELVFDGVKMVADVSLNGVSLGFTADQFLRYTFPVTGVLKATGNVLTVTFTRSGDSRNAEGRWMACSGGWDWAPYSTTNGPNGATTFSKGLWKSVYVVSYSYTSLEYVVPQVFYGGAYPTAPLTDASAGPFSVAVRVHFNSVSATTGSLSVCGSWGGACNTSQVSLPAGSANTTLTLAPSAGSVSLWWPAGVGAQALYNVSVTFTPSGGSVLNANRRIGFRVFTLVTGNDTDPSTLAGQDGSDTFTMRFRVNGANIWSRGGNQIPMEELEGRQNAAAYSYMLHSAVDAGMNTLRLWGGGIFMPNVFYDTADELGLLIYHDMMYAQGGHSPAATPMQDAELRHQVRRLASHPSVAVWDSCNECGGHGIYASFVATTVVSEDASRPPWPSCPSGGWNSGVDRLWSLPNGSPLGLQPRAVPPTAVQRERASSVKQVVSRKAADVPCTFLPNVDFDQGTIGPSPPATSSQDCCNQCAASPSNCYAATFASGTCWFKNYTQSQLPGYNSGVTGCLWGNHTIPPLPPPTPPHYSTETHGPYQHGNGFPTVNSPGSLSLFSPNVPPSLAPSVATGPEWWGTYASEFGGVAPSSFESFAPTLSPADWGIHAPPMSQRNYAMDNFIVTYFGLAPNRSDIGETAFQRQLYLAMIGQALEMKSDISNRRSANSFGTVTWQLNEIWPTGGWGSIEYGTVGYTPGQVIGGRWKPLQYFMRRALYRDVFVTCGSDGRCMVKNDDALAAFNGAVTTAFLHVSTGAVSVANVTSVSLPMGAGASYFFCLGAGSAYTMQCAPPSSALAASGCAADGSDCILLLNVTDAGTGASVCSNFELMTIPGNMTLPAAAVTAAVQAPNGDGSVPIVLTSNATALFVTLTTQAQGRFDDNAVFVAPTAAVTLTFVPFGALNYTLLTSSLRVEHMGQYL